jgi:hypothetical protein
MHEALAAGATSLVADPASEPPRDAVTRAADLRRFPPSAFLPANV